MTKDRIIRDVHKILYIYEDGIYDNYVAYLEHIITEFSGLECNDTIDKSLILLKGLLNRGEEITHSKLKPVVMHIMNEIDRNI